MIDHQPPSERKGGFCFNRCQSARVVENSWFAWLSWLRAEPRVRTLNSGPAVGLCTSLRLSRLPTGLRTSKILNEINYYITPTIYVKNTNLVCHSGLVRVLPSQLWGLSVPANTKYCARLISSLIIKNNWVKVFFFFLKISKIDVSRILENSE